MMHFFRAIDFWLALTAFVLMGFVNVFRWRAMDRPDRLVRVGFATLLAAAAYGFGITPNTPLGFILRYLLFSTALLFLVIALAWMLYRQVRRRRTFTQPPSDQAGVSSSPEAMS